MGEGYNRASLTATAEECLDEDITIEIDESKPMDDLDVRYLRAMKLLQDKQRLTKQQEILNAKLEALKLREDEIFKH